MLFHQSLVTVSKTTLLLFVLLTVLSCGKETETSLEQKVLVESENSIQKHIIPHKKTEKESPQVKDFKSSAA